MTRTAPSQWDPFGWGLVLCFDPRTVSFTASAAVWPGANRCLFLRTMTGGTISKIRLEVGVSSGNISVAAYANNGTGLLAVPSGVPLSTSGAVACPATGLADVALAAAVTVAPGDWLALSCDNTTATFSKLSQPSAIFNDGLAWRQTTGHPAPSPVGTLAATSYLPVLIGIP